MEEKLVMKDIIIIEQARWDQVKQFNDGKEDEKEEEDEEDDDLPSLEDDDNVAPVFNKKEAQQKAIAVVQNLVATLEKRQLRIRSWKFPDVFAPYLLGRIFDLLEGLQEINIASNENGFLLENCYYHDYRIKLKTTERTVDTTVNFYGNTGKNCDAFCVKFGHELEVPFFRVFLGELFEEKTNTN